jgi:homoaconitase/3-isopropylmalate dehydratase large subunit
MGIITCMEGAAASNSGLVGQSKIHSLGLYRTFLLGFAAIRPACSPGLGMRMEKLTRCRCRANTVIRVWEITSKLQLVKLVA